MPHEPTSQAEQNPPAADKPPRHPRRPGGDPMRRIDKPLVSLTEMVLNNGAEQPHGLTIKRKPPWLRAKVPGGEGYTRTKSIMNQHRLFTVCE